MDNIKKVVDVLHEIDDTLLQELNAKDDFGNTINDNIALVAYQLCKLVEIFEKAEIVIMKDRK